MLDDLAGANHLHCFKTASKKTITYLKRLLSQEITIKAEEYRSITPKTNNKQNFRGHNSLKYEVAFPSQAIIEHA